MGFSSLVQFTRVQTKKGETRLFYTVVMSYYIIVDRLGTCSYNISRMYDDDNIICILL